MTVSCSKESATEKDDVVFVAYSSPDPKAVFGDIVDNKLKTLWENNDAISIYDYSTTQDVRPSYIFRTSLESNASSAEFTYTQNYGEFAYMYPSRYLAIYPHTESNRVVNFEASTVAGYDDDVLAYRMAAVDVPSSQILVKNSFDRSSRVMLAYAENYKLFFRNAVSMVKFKVAGSGICYGAITTLNNEPIGGRFRAHIMVDSDDVLLYDYSEITSATVNFCTGSLSSPMAQETDYYVSVRPVDLANGFKISLNGKVVSTVSTVDNAFFQRNNVYDLGTLSYAEDSDDRILNVDFSITSEMQGWPTTNQPDGAEVSTVLEASYDGYKFTLQNPTDAQDVNFPYISNGLLYIKSYRFLGLPAIEGYKLSAVTIVNASSNAHHDRTVGVTTKVSAQTDQGEVGQVFVAGGASQAVGDNTNRVYSYILDDTSANTRYYLRAGKRDIAISNLILRYTPVP